ncbi:hypothetical protein EYC84_000190 [Monilinia fructicola]|uniref:Asl1-like glycosyl hydrolase catalytic domain-containing protein n=1 Tax=Monilinia fructicola TaxID=38448 RepID=A0A5M9JMR4_MONFR|nr:hypothetical protein EYC84_000190 [Monilinia fructicola]
MHLTSTLLLTATSCIPLILADSTETVGSSSKRGLVFVPNSKYPTDNQIWVQPGSDLTWYYNYGIAASPAYSNLTQEEFEFVPMLWGTSNTFLADTKSLISDGRNITHVLTYNEPDGTSSTGGSAILPSAAAANWISQVEPLRKLGVKTGAPAVTGSERGFTWLGDFFRCVRQSGDQLHGGFHPGALVWEFRWPGESHWAGSGDLPQHINLDHRVRSERFAPRHHSVLLQYLGRIF